MDKCTKIKKNSQYTITEITQYVLTFIMILLSFAHKNDRLILYSFEIIYICVMSLQFINKKLSINKYITWSYIFITICLASYLYAFDQSAALKQVINILKILLIGNSIVIFINRDYKKIEFIFRCIVISGLYLSIKLIMKTPLSDFQGSRIGRSVGMNPNDLGFNLAIAALIAIFFIIMKKKIYYIPMVIFIPILISTGSRKAFLFLVFGAICININKVNRIIPLLRTIIITILILIVSYNIVMKVPQIYEVLGVRLEGLFNLFGGDGNVDNSAKVRMILIKDGIQMFKESMLLGYGVGNYAELSSYKTYSHNNYVELLVSVGIIGTIAYYSIYIYILYKLIPNIRDNKYASIIFVLIVGILIMEYGLVTYYVEIFQIVLSTSFVIADTINRNKRGCEICEKKY